MPRCASLDEWLLWQESLHPREIDLGLERIRHVWELLGGGKPAPLVITVAGTNGKGSSSLLLEQIYLGGGYKVGCFTSPHLLRYNERIRINGVEVSDVDLCAIFARIDLVRGNTSLTYFEFNALAAFCLFRDAALDVAILEVGLGGRLDGCNIIDADVALITSIGLDHQNWLGDSREQIAREKAGVFRKHCPAVCGDPDPPQSLFEEVMRAGAMPVFLGQNFEFHKFTDSWSWIYKDDKTVLQALPFPAIPGIHIMQNAAAVLAVVHQLRLQIPVKIDALKKAISRLSVPGRFQKLACKPDIIVDVAHNEDAIKALCQVLGDYPAFHCLHLVFGMLSDKDLPTAIRLLKPYADSWYFAAPNSARAYPVEALLLEASRHDINAEKQGYTCVEDAFYAAYKNAGKEDVILVTGSFFTVAEVLAAYTKLGL